MQQLLSALSVLGHLGVNLLITVLAMLIPFGAGTLMYLFSEKNGTLATIFRWVSLPFEAICPVVLLVTVYYVGNVRLPVIIYATLVLSVAYFGYMPARFVEQYSFRKNLLLGGLGLFGAIFKWSFCLGMIGHLDALGYAYRQSAVNFDYLVPLLTVFASSAVLLLAVEVIKRLVKQKMD